MAKKKTETSKKINQSSGPTKSVEMYEHKGSKRLNNPQVGLVNTKTEKEEKKKAYSYDPHLDPSLMWTGKPERLSFEVPTVSLHVHERIDPRTIIEAVKKSPEKIWQQFNLFNNPVNKLNFIKEIEFYKHEKDWSNRLIAGDSLLVMNSLIEKEGLAAKVQTIYFDPPYGIKYGSNFQPFVNKKEVKDGSDDDLNQEPEMIRAFRDTWELGIHSYLSSIRDRILTSRELLNESGSMFTQISDENLAHVVKVMDEVFGAENRVAIIPFIKTSGQTDKLISSVNDYLVWYAKDKKKVKYNQLYLEKNLSADVDGAYNNILLPDGSNRKLTEEEKINPKLIPEGGRIFRHQILTSQSPGSRYKVQFEGEEYYPKTGYWKTQEESMYKLIAAGRIAKTGNTLSYIRFADDFPVKPLNNFWDDTGWSLGVEKTYAVQTSLKVAERCLLMTSNPGDLVFDPTCGSGTIPYVAEKFGRRWISCDTSRISIFLAKARLMTSVFDYYQLRNPEEGVGSGFQYQVVPHVTLKSIANNTLIRKGMNAENVAKAIELQSEKETLIDKPNIDKDKARVCGPFTVEAVPAPIVRSVDNTESMESTNSKTFDWISELLKTGIRSKGKEYVRLKMLEPLQGTRWVHASGYTEEKIPQRIVVSFGPDFAPLEQKQIELAINEVEKLKPSPTIVVFAAFQFDPEAAKDIDDLQWEGVSILKVQMNSDLFTEDLKKKRSSNESFWLIGQPDIDVELLRSGESKGKYVVKIGGFDYYNPKTGGVESGTTEQIAMWMLDTDYDGRSLLPRQVFFPMSGAKDGWSKLSKALKNEIDEELIESYRGTVSLPFEPSEHRKIAVKIIDDRGIESLIVQELDK